MLTSRRRIAAATSVVALLVLSACTSGDDSGDANGNGDALTLSKVDENPDDVCTTDRQGGTLRFRTNPEGAGLDPAVSQANQNGAGAIYGTLIKWNNDKSEFEGDLAESITPNDDATQWTLKLRDDVVYPDGTALDAAAVEKSISRFVDPNFASAFSSRVAEITAMDTSDPQTVVFTLGEPWGTFPDLLTQNPGMIINPNVLDTVAPDVLASAPPVDAGAGAFVLSAYQRGESMTLERKDEWWGGPVCLDELVLTFGANDAVADYEALQAGQVDAFHTYDTDPLQNADAADGLMLYKLPGSIGSPMLMNSSQPPFDDVRVRKALSLSMDRELINDRIFDGLMSESGAALSPDVAPNLSVEPTKFDLDEAKRLLDEAAADGAAVDFDYAINRSPINENLAILQQSLAGNVGFDMTVDNLQQPDWIEKIFGTRNFDVAMGGLFASSSCPFCGIDQFSSDSATNVSAFDSPAVDDALTKLKAAKPGPELDAALDDLQEVWNEEVPVVIVSWISQVLVADEAVRGLRFSSSYTQVHFEQAYIAE